MTALYSRFTLPSLSVIRSLIYRIENNVKQLKQNHRNDDIILLMSEPFITTAHDANNSSSSLGDDEVCSNVSDQTVLKTCTDCHELTTVNKALAGELSEVLNKLEVKESKTGTLATKLSKLSVCNTNKKLKRRDEKVIELKEQVKDKQKLEHSLQQATTRIRSYQCRLTNAKNKYDSISQKCDSLQMFIKDLHEELELTTVEVHCVIQKINMNAC